MAEPKFESLPTSIEAHQSQNTLSLEANGNSAPTIHRPERHRSYLEVGVDYISSTFITDKKKLAEVDHYACEFAKTATLFAGGKFGLAGTFLVYGLAQASPDDRSKLTQIEDFALGAAKGGSIKKLFGLVGEKPILTPLKGVLMGMSSRGAEAVFQRETFTKPSRLVGLAADELNNRETWLAEGVIFAAGHGLFKAGSGLFGRSELAAASLMGGSFGAVNGAAGEIERQRAEGKGFDFGRIFERTALQAGLDAAAAGLGSRSTQIQARSVMGRLRKSINKLHQLSGLEAEDLAAKPPVSGNWIPREFQIVSGHDALEAFRAGKAPAAMLTVRELSEQSWASRGTGQERKLFVQRLRMADHALLPESRNADLVASCYPENLSGEQRAKHVFGEAAGKVWLQTGPENRLLLSAGWHPLSTWCGEGYTEPFKLNGGNVTLSAMGPLEVGNPRRLESAASVRAWADFDKDLADAKELGLHSISTDVWWNVIEPNKGVFDWSYYDKLAAHIVKAGLKWTPILSFHSCGGNVGDTVREPLPNWVWADMAKDAPGRNPEALKYVSEQGHSSPEYVSCWATDLALPYYEYVMQKFQEHYQNYAPHIAEINISLGPAGELRMPSYNSHDEGTGYPTRGALQCYSVMAKESFRKHVLQKYGGDIAAVAKAWEIDGLTAAKIGPPDNADEFFEHDNHINMQYGRDFIDWYHESLVDHGYKIMSTALKVFGSRDSAFAGIEIGGKVPGVHWHVGEQDDDKLIPADRLAEITAGLVRTSDGNLSQENIGLAYGHMLSMFSRVQKGSESPVIPAFTAIEMPDGQDGRVAHSLARSLAISVGSMGRSLGLQMGAETALSGNLYSSYCMDNALSLLDLEGAQGVPDYHDRHNIFTKITFLRLKDALNPVAKAKIAEILTAIHSLPAPGTQGH